MGGWCMYNQNNQKRLPSPCRRRRAKGCKDDRHNSGHTPPPHRSAPKPVPQSHFVSTCRQNRSFVTRRTKPGNSGRLPPSAAVQGRSSGRAASSRGGGGAECSECSARGSECTARPPRIARSTASTPACSSVVWGAWAGKRSVRFPRLRSWRFF